MARCGRQGRQSNGPGSRIQRAKPIANDRRPHATLSHCQPSSLQADAIPDDAQRRLATQRTRLKSECFAQRKEGAGAPADGLTRPSNVASPSG
jgi:hypothetical protein